MSSINTIDFTSLDTKDLSRDWIIEGWLAKGDLAALAGEPYSGKSFLAQYLAMGITFGETWIPKLKIPKPRRVLYIDEDNNRSSIELRLQTIPKKRGKEPSDWTGKMPYLYSNGLTLEKCKNSNGLLEERFHPELIIIDSLYCFVGVDLNKGDAIGVIRPKFRAMQAVNGDCTILLIHHLKKKQVGSPKKRAVSDMLGSTFIHAMCDTVAMLTVSGDIHSLTNEKLRLDPEAAKKNRGVEFMIDDHVVKVVN